MSLHCKSLTNEPRSYYQRGIARSDTVLSILRDCLSCKVDVMDYDLVN